MTEQAVLEGLISIQAALKAQSRPIQAVYIRQDKRDHELTRLETAARNAGISVERVPSETIEAHVQGQTHGGVIALVGERRFVQLEELADVRAHGGSPLPTPAPFVVMLDGVEDPFNFGQAVRAFYAAGADGLVVRPRNWMSAAGTVARASAGASELIPTAVAETAEDAADFFRERGLTIAVTDINRAVSIYEADLTGPLFMLVGGEKRGVTRSFADRADVRLQIPYGRSFGQSLGTTAAAAVLAFEVMRQRRSSK